MTDAVFWAACSHRFSLSEWGSQAREMMLTFVSSIHGFFTQLTKRREDKTITTPDKWKKTDEWINTTHHKLGAFVSTWVLFLFGLNFSKISNSSLWLLLLKNEKKHNFHHFHAFTIYGLQNLDNNIDSSNIPNLSCVCIYIYCIYFWNNVYDCTLKRLMLFWQGSFSSGLVPQLQTG